jgi:hypothetical protein
MLVPPFACRTDLLRRGARHDEAARQPRSCSSSCQPSTTSPLDA